MSKLSVIILAAGKGTRMQSALPKVLHPLCGRPMIDYVIEAARSLKPKKICLVLHHGEDEIKKHLTEQKDLCFVRQSQPLGTAHAVQAGLEAFDQDNSGQVLILSGDVPLIRPKTLRALVNSQRTAPLKILTTTLAQEAIGYGRILRGDKGALQGIVEEGDATEAQKKIREINAGLYCVDVSLLRTLLPKIKKNPKKGEYYLTDLIALALQAGQKVLPIHWEDFEELQGINTPGDLYDTEQDLRLQIIFEHFERGVRIQNVDDLYIDSQVKVGEGSYLSAGVQLLGKTRLGKNCHVEPGCILKDVQLGNAVVLKAYSHLEDCKVADGATVGPFARLRPGTILEENSRVGNFVELKKTRLGKGSKANHLSYLGDANIGDQVNIGAGTITCNYDGTHKFITVIESGAFIGSDSQLVAPVTVGKGAYVASGTTVTCDVPPKSLAIARVPQQNIKGWAQKKKRD